MRRYFCREPRQDFGSLALNIVSQGKPRIRLADLCFHDTFQVVITSIV